MADNDRNEQLELATFGGGCFWCLEAIFGQLEGVEKVGSGFSGGSVKDPSYKQVCDGDTGHAEVVQIAFDPERISYGELLAVFFSVHDPTTKNRQGADIGTQYRSAIFWHNTAQRAEAERVIRELDREGFWPRPIVTELEPYEAFYPAEAYHQEYYERNSEQAYCQLVISPKLEKFRKKFSDRLK